MASAITNITVTVNWSAPQDANGVISDYTLILFLGDSAGEPVNLTSSAFSYEFENLTPYTNYSAVIYATTAGGPGQNATLAFTTDIGSTFLKPIE